MKRPRAAAEPASAKRSRLCGEHEKAEQGIWPSYAPLGYVNVDGTNGKRTIQPDPQLVPVIRKMFEWYSTGEYSPGRNNQEGPGSGHDLPEERELGA